MSVQSFVESTSSAIKSALCDHYGGPFSDGHKYSIKSAVNIGCSDLASKMQQSGANSEAMQRARDEYMQALQKEHSKTFEDAGVQLLWMGQ